MADTSEAPRRIQMTRQRPWRKDHPDAVIVARPSKWGNPWKVGAPGKLDMPGIVCCLTVDLEAALAVEWYRAWIEGYALHKDARPHNLNSTGRRLVWDILAKRRAAIWEAMPSLRGKDLACWCPLDAPCHADTLLEIANAE